MAARARQMRAARPPGPKPEDQLDLERHADGPPSGCSPGSPSDCLAACLGHNWSISTTNGRSLIAYDH
jgi:hypothetical protein